jgi:hypothetical protein
LLLLLYSSLFPHDRAKKDICVAQWLYLQNT